MVCLLVAQRFQLFAGSGNGWLNSAVISSSAATFEVVKHFWLCKQVLYQVVYGPHGDFTFYLFVVRHVVGRVVYGWQGVQLLELGACGGSTHRRCARCAHLHGRSRNTCTSASPWTTS